MGLAIAFMILALCFMFMAGMMCEAEVNQWPLWILASVAASFAALVLGGVI